MIKLLTTEELPRLEGILNEFAKASGHPGGFCRDAFDPYWKVLLDANIGQIFYEDDEDGKILGVLGAAFTPDMFSGRLVASEAFWFLLPEARGQRLSIRLLDAYEAFAKFKGCKQILMVSLSALSPEVVGAIYTRRGFTVLEVVYTKEI